jgi:hypothetical protein
VLVLRRPFQPGVMFAVKTEAYLIVEHLKGSSLGKVPALLITIRLGWKCLPRTNTIAYVKHL